MTFTVSKSMIPENFPELVDAHIKALMDHRTKVNVPTPTAEPLVEMSVKRLKNGGKRPDDFIADYAILDDVPAQRGTVAEAE